MDIINELDHDDIEELARHSPLIHFSAYLRIYYKDNREIQPEPKIFQIRMNEAIMTLQELNVPVRILGTKIRQCGGTTFSLEAGYHTGRNRKIDAVIIAYVSSNSEKLLSRLSDYKQTG